ncbi:lipopolysaccharide heptosyltransferase I [Candidatus Pseudothioglobus singularis]|nr:lipopolysaccharide heptosyltransferase I [Candidatus Pseudothioglobus singularis]
MKIAIVKVSSLGDIVHTMVVLQFIKKHYPLSEVDWIVEERFQDILEGNPSINQIHTINLHEAKKNKSLKLLFIELKKVRSFGVYDLVIDFQGLIKTAIISRLLGCKKIVGFDSNSIREMIASYAYNENVSIGYDKNTILRNVKLVSEALNIEITKDEIINKKLFLFSKSKLLIPKSPFIILVASSGWESRNYPKEKYVEVANILKKDCLILWGNDKERQKAEWMTSKSKYIKILPKLNLDDLKYVISRASLLIGNDTGPSHMSWALNIPSIVLFGPTPTERSFQTPINIVLASNSKINHRKLDKKDFSIKEINVNDVVKIAKKLLKVDI